jgi:hypothetical protein
LEDVNWINMAENKEKLGSYVNTVLNFRVPYNAQEILEWLRILYFLIKDSTAWSWRRTNLWLRVSDVDVRRRDVNVYFTRLWCKVR